MLLFTIMCLLTTRLFTFTGNLVFSDGFFTRALLSDRLSLFDKNYFFLCSCFTWIQCLYLCTIVCRCFMHQIVLDKGACEPLFSVLTLSLMALICLRSPMFTVLHVIFEQMLCESVCGMCVGRF